MKTVVFIETNFSGLDAIVYCKEKGYHSVLVTDSRERFKKWFPASSLYKVDLADQIISVNNSNDKDEVISALKQQVKQIDAMLTFAEIRTHVTSQICRELGLSGANPEAIQIAQNKSKFRQVLIDKGVDDVQYHQINTPDELKNICDSLSFPVFLKPVQGHSSIGAKVCRNKDDVDALIAMLNAISEDWISHSYVVEDFLDGQLVSVEILTIEFGKHQVVGISDRDVIDSSIEIGASFPLKNAYKQVIEEKACEALDAIGYDFGPSHVELILTETGPHLVEVNTRVGGSGHSIMLELSTGRSIVGDCVELCLGNISNDEKLYEHKQGAAWHCFVSAQSGVLEALPSEEQLAVLPGVEHIWLHKATGDTVSGLDSNYSWVVQVMCTGKEQADAKRKVTEAIQYVSDNVVIV
ncbi:ATP-grasp domain-containing protein [Pseudoalteromonas piscicida]|uniref:ATP-grasp domain-containing protein n=1 Tax=Pseudoalteromonas piscicida TaxID=43662 RepID=UPI001C974BEE|nr:ATP-grasp domain-containing protein [Pseudoalteromonas piscicida]QZO15126.1 ATP-grasp domain-containing protein [Pseudoalteromonas piscicida]